MAYNGHVQIQMAVAGDENGLELESEQDVLRMICEHSDFAMAELWSFGSGAAGLDASISTMHFRDKSTHSMGADRSFHDAMAGLSNAVSSSLKRSGSRNSMGGTSRTGTHMSAVDCKYLSFTGVGYTDLAYVNLGATRSGAKGAGADIEAGQTDRNGQRRADASIHLPPIPGPARMPLMGEGETMQGLMSALEQRRLDASLTRGQGLPGSVWQTLAQDFVILPHLLDNPEHPRDDLLPLYAKLFLAALGIPIRSASATNKIQGVLMLYLPYNTADGDLVEQAAAAIKYLEPSIDSALSIFLSRASELLAALSYRRTRAMDLLHAARRLAPADVLALDGNGAFHTRERLTNKRAHADGHGRPAAPPEGSAAQGGIVRKFVKKCGGQNGKPAPALDAKGCATTFLGVFVSIFAIAVGAEACARSGAAGTEYASMVSGQGSGVMMVLGSFGALATLLFAAPASPFAQPRNVVGGHLMACVTAVGVDYLANASLSPGGAAAVLPHALAVALVPALVITTMARAGLTNPPAAACALIYISAPAGSFVKAMGWRFFAPVMLGCMVQLAVSLLLNNLVPFRSYPVFW